MDCTQVLDDINFGDATHYKEGEKKQLGCLEIAGVKHSLYNGENLIGRDASCCSVSVSSKALSKEHAVIEIIDEDNHLIYDLGSRNKTRLGKMILQPHVRYQLPDGAKLHLADVSAVYQRLSDNVEGDSDSGSETGSESMLTVNNSVVEDTVIVPETPALSCAKQKSVVAVAESPCSSSDIDSSFGFTKTSKSDMLRNDNIGGVLIGRAEESKDHPEVKQATDDDNMSEAETQCDVDCLGVNKLHVGSVSHGDKICASAPNEEEDIFEAETQCEESSLTVPVKSFGASDPKKEDFTLRPDTDIPNKEIKVDVVSKVKVVPKSIILIKQENVKVRNVNRQHTTDHQAAKHMDNSCRKHDDELYNAPAPCLLGERDETSLMDKTDAVSVCSERTEEYVYDDASLSSHEDADNRKSVQEKADNKDLENLTQRKAVCFESQMAQVSLSDQDGQQTEQPARARERKSSADTKVSLNVSYNEDSFDRSMLDGDDDLFAFQVTQISDPKEGAFKTNKMTEQFNEVHQENKSKSNITNCDDPQTALVSLSKQFTVKQLKSEKMLSASKASEKCISDKSESYQAQNGSVNISEIFQVKTKDTVKCATAGNKETAKLSNDSGDEMDADSTVEVAIENQEQLHGSKKDLRLSLQLCHDSGYEKDSEAKSQIILPPVSNSKTISKLSGPSSRKDSSETSISINSENIKTKTQSPTHPGNAATQDRNIEKQNKVIDYENKINRELEEYQDSSKQDVSLTVTNKPAVICSEKEKAQTQLSVECKDDNDSDDEVFMAPTQLLFPANRNRDFRKPPAASRKKTTDITAVSSSNSVKVPAQLNSAFADNDHGDDDSISEAATQIVESANKGSGDFTKSLTLSPVEEKLNADHFDDDDDDNIYEAATQIVGTPNNSGKDFTKPLTSSPVEDKTDAEHDNDDFIFEAETQIMETANRSSKDSSEPLAPSPVDEKLSADHDADDNIYEASTQIVEAPNKSSKDSSEPLAPSPVDEKLSADHDADDNIYEASTQIVETPNKSSRDSTEPLAPFPVDEKLNADHDVDDNIYEAATQIVETPNKSSKDFTKPFTSTSAEEKTDAEHGNDDFIFEAETQIMETPNRSSEDSTEPLAPSPVDVKLNADHDVDDNIYEAATQIVETPNKSSKDFTKPFTSSSAEDKTDAELDDSDSIFEAATQIAENAIKNNFTETSKHSSGSNTADIQAIMDDREVKKLHSSTGTVDEDNFEYPIDPCDNADIDNICSGSAQNVNFPENKITELQERERSASRGSCSVMPKAKGYYVNKSKAVELNQNFPIQDNKNTALITPKVHFGEIARTERDAMSSDDGETSELKQSKASEDKIVNVEKDADENHKKVESEEKETSHTNERREPEPAESESQKLSCRDDQGETLMAKSLQADDSTVCAQKSSMKQAEKAHGAVMRAQRKGDGKCGMEESKKPGVPTVDFQKGNDVVYGMKESEVSDDNAACDQRDRSGEPVISYPKKPSNVLDAQKECGQETEMSGSQILDDTHLSLHDDSGDETDPENVFKVDSHEIKMESNSYKLSAVQISALPISSEETVHKVRESEVICIEDKRPSASLILPQDTVTSFVSSTEDKKGLTQTAESVDTAIPVQSAKVSTKPISAGSSCSKKTSVVSLTPGIDNCNDSLIVAAKVQESGDQSVGENCVSELSSSFIISAVASPLSQDQSTENREQSLNSELQASTPSDHMKDTDRAEKTPLVSIRTEPDSEGLEPKDSSIQKENDSKSCPDINQQTLLGNERSVFEEADRIADEPMKDSLNDVQDLIMPLTQDLLEAMKESEEQKSPFKPEEHIPSEDEEPDTTPKVGRHNHLPNKGAKVRKRLNIDSRSSDTTRSTSRRRRRLPVEDTVQNNKSDITVRASKQRKLSDKNSVQNSSRNKATDGPSHSRTDGSAGEFQQSENEAIVSSDDVNISKGRKSKIIAAKSKGQRKTVSSTDFQDINVKVLLEGCRTERSSRSKVERKDQDLSSEQCDEQRGERKSLRHVAKSTEDNGHNEARKSRRERSINKNENGKNSFETNSRPPRQRRMTWKIRDSLVADCSQGSVTPEEKPKNRSRGSSSSNSQNEINESLQLCTDTTMRSRNTSSSKSPSKKLLKNSEDSSNDICKEAKDTRGTNSVSHQQNVSLRKSARLSKGDNAVTSVIDPPKIESPQRTTRQNDRKKVRTNVQKRKNEEIFTELSSKRSKRENKVFPVDKSPRNSTDKCSPKTSKRVLNTDESFEGVSEFSTRASSRKGTQTASVCLMQEHSAFVTSSSTAERENKKQRTVLTKTNSSIGIVQGNTRRWVRSRMEVTNTSPSCLKDLNILQSSTTSNRTHQSVKRTKLSAEEDSEHSPPKQAKSGKRLYEPCSSPSESSTQNVKVELRTSRTRGKVTSPQKLEVGEMTKHKAKPGQRERTSKISMAEETDISVIPTSRKMNLSEDQDTTPKLTRSSRRKGTPQSSSQLNSQKNGNNSGVSTPRRSSQRKVAGGTTYQVLFTGFSDTKQESIVRQLDPWQFLIKDHESESKFKFRLQESLEAASRTNLLAGYSVYVTPKVKPSPSEMKGIIESCGGVFINQAPNKSWPINSFIISCLDDRSMWCKLRKAGKPIVGAELLLLGVLQQKLDLVSNTLV
ncbi:uncharacterized protein LOC111867156 isoform X2 [Cryptotermes secundus]|nr:uncharacterized protein LOC111867156 isoform X2 [Cryptotermes secundus]